MTEKKYTCHDCLYADKIWGLQYTVYCKCLNDCYNDSKANDCKEYVDKKIFKELNNESARMEIKEP